MNGHGHSSRRALLLTVAVATLIVGPVILYWVLPLAGVPAALVSGVVLVAAVKHLGLLAVTLPPLYALVRQWRRR